MLGGCAAGGGANVLACTAGQDANVVPIHDDNSYVRQLRGDDDSEDDMPLNDGKDVDNHSDVYLNDDKTPLDEPHVAHDTALVVDADQDSCSLLALQSEVAETAETEEVAEEEREVKSGSTPCRAPAKSGNSSSSQAGKTTESFKNQLSKTSKIKEQAVRMTNDDAAAAYDKICSFENIGSPAAKHCIGSSDGKRDPPNSLDNAGKESSRDVHLMEDEDNIELMHGSSEPNLVLVSDADEEDDEAIEGQAVSLDTKLTRVGSKQSTQTDGTASTTQDMNEEVKTRTSNSLQETVVQVSRRGTGFLESLFSWGIPCIDKKDPTLLDNEIRDIEAEDEVQPSEAPVRGNEDEVNLDVEDTAEETKVVAKNESSMDDEVHLQSKIEATPDGIEASTVKKEKRRKSRMNGVRMRVFKQLSKKKRERKKEDEVPNGLEVRHVRVVA